MAGNARGSYTLKVRLYIDEDAADADLADALRARGLDVLTVQDAQMLGRSDDEQLHYSTQQNRALYTFNRKDFMLLHTAFLDRGEAHAGIILGEHRRYSIGEQMRRLLTIASRVPAEEMQNRLIFLSAWGER